MRSRPIRRLALLSAMLLALAACGGGPGPTAPTLPTAEAAGRDDSSTTTTTTEAVAPEDAFQDYSDCMREHGVEMPDPGAAEGGGMIIVGGEDIDFEDLEQASAACDSILEGAFGEFEMTPEMEAEMRDQELAFARCMRDNGIEDWPDPTGDVAAGMSLELPDNLDPDDLNVAMEACSQEIFGSGGGIILGDETP